MVGLGADDIEYRLMRDLLRRYDLRVRPSLNASEPLNVTFGLALAQIIDVVSAIMFLCFSAYLSVLPSLSLSLSLSLYVAVAPTAIHFRLAVSKHPMDINWLEVDTVIIGGDTFAVQIRQQLSIMLQWQAVRPRVSWRSAVI